MAVLQIALQGVDNCQRAHRTLHGHAWCIVASSPAGLTLDNGSMRFQGVRVPRENLLDRFASVDRTGAYRCPYSASRRFAATLGELTGGRVGLTCSSLGILKARSSCGRGQDQGLLCLAFAACRHCVCLPCARREPMRPGAGRADDCGPLRRRAAAVRAARCAGDCRAGLPQPAGEADAAAGHRIRACTSPSATWSTSTRRPSAPRRRMSSPTCTPSRLVRIATRVQHVLVHSCSPSSVDGGVACLRKTGQATAIAPAGSASPDALDDHEDGARRPEGVCQPATLPTRCRCAGSAAAGMAMQQSTGLASGAQTTTSSRPLRATTLSSCSRCALLRMVSRFALPV